MRFRAACCVGALLLAAAGARGAAQSPPPASIQPPTFSRDVAPIVFAHCAACHRPDGVAPFALLTYASVKAKASLVAAATRARLMPPWKSEPGYGEFIGHQHLTDAEIEVIQRWNKAGAPEGDRRELPPVPSWSSGWQMGAPDLVVTWPQAFTVTGEGPDFSRTFVLPLPVSSPRYVRGFEFKPGNAAVVHHANIRVDRTRRSRQLDEEDPAPGYQGLLPPSAVYPDGHFLGWTPGQVGPLLPEALAWRLHPGTDLVVEMHFVPSGRTETVQPSVGLYFGNQAPERTPVMLRLGRQNLEIPPDDSAYISTDSFVLPVDVEVLALQPHAHYLAREVHGDATLPDGTRQPLIYIKEWDYRWQHVYRYVTPQRLPKGTTLSLRYVFDNSAANVRNPHQPPRHVTWGQRSTDEMGDLWVQMVTATDRERGILEQRVHPKETAEEITGYETMIRRDPAKASLHNDVAVMYDELGRPDLAAPHFETVVALQPRSAAAHYNLATSLLASGQPERAVEEYGLALRLQPVYGVAENNLGLALMRLARPHEALNHFRRAAQQDPMNPEPHYNMALLLRAGNDEQGAIDELRKAARLEGRKD